MGPLGGVQTLEARVNGTLMATATATTCDPSRLLPVGELSSTLSAATLLIARHVRASGQAVHPDVVRGHWRATGFWLAITPYPGGNSPYENPSIFRSRDAHTWAVTAGRHQSVVQPEATGYLSDPDMVVDSDQKLWMYYRAVREPQNIIKVIRSADGVHWDAPTTVVTVPSHQVVSPSVVRGAPEAPWQMWSVNAGPAGLLGAGHHRRAPHVARRPATGALRLTVDLVQPGQSIWHIDVQWIPARSEYWALYNTYPIGTAARPTRCTWPAARTACNWTVYPSPIARAGVDRPRSRT